MAKTYDLVFQVTAQFQGQFVQTLSTAAGQVAKLSKEVLDFSDQIRRVVALQKAKGQLEELRKEVLQAKDSCCRSRGFASSVASSAVDSQ